MHGEIVHQSADDVIRGCGVDWWGQVDEDGLGDVDVLVGGVEAGNTSENPAYGEDDATPGDKEGDSPEPVVTIFDIN